MRIEVAALCDAATDQSGKLNMLGVFDHIEAELPVIVQRCSAVFRLRYTRSEAALHEFALSITNMQSGKELIPPIESKVTLLPVPETMDSTAVNMILNMNRLQIKEEGKYLLRLRIDQMLAEIALPLYIRDLTPKEPNPLAS